jgi:hypothetical protein
MNRKIGKTLRVIIVAGIIASMMGAVQIRTRAMSVDELYVQVYTATTNTMEKKTQKSINEARTAIETLRNTGAEWAIGEFSKQVDQIQHPYLVKIVDSINAAMLTVKQADINAARAAIDPELPEVWRYSYSSAIDGIQQDLMQRLIDTYYTAVMYETEENLTQFDRIFADIKQAVNPEIGAWAEEFTKPMRDIWNDAEIDVINNMLLDINSKIETEEYSIIRVNPDNEEIITLAFYDTYKAVKRIINIAENYNKTVSYSNNQYVSISDFSAGKNGFETNQIFFKDNKILKWITIEFDNAGEYADSIPGLSSENIKAIKVYDERNLPQDLKNKFSVYQQDSVKMLLDAKAQIK